jgi:hypothetical protein
MANQFPHITKNWFGIKKERTTSTAHAMILGPHHLHVNGRTKLNFGVPVLYGGTRITGGSDANEEGSEDEMQHS